jgi:O-antigen/teichoic acid export membrane protein
MNNRPDIRGRLLFRNTALNFIGRLVPLGIAVFTIPYVIHGLGVERFGILSLAWVILGYLSLFDLGLGRATTKFVAEELGKDKIERIPKIIWTSLTVQTIMGAVGGIVLAVVTPVLVDKILRIPPDLVNETKLIFYILSVSVPLVICSRNLVGVLEASQRFDLINAIQIPSSSLGLLIPAIGVSIGLTLPSIIVFLAVSWVVSTLVYFFLCLRVFPPLREGITIDPRLFRPLFTFGGWVTLSNALIPLLLYLDRFIIGAVISIAAISYYTAPYEVVSKLLIFPGVLAVTLFPAISGLSPINRKGLEGLYARSLKYIILIMGPIVAVAILFARDILKLWLGGDFPVRSTDVFHFLALGMLLNALAQMAATLLDGIGRPDIRAKVFVSYVPLYVVLLWLLIGKYGIDGAALAWALRAGLELILFFETSRRLLHINSGVFVTNGLLRGLMALGGFCLIVMLGYILINGILIQSLYTLIGLIFFTFIAWKYALDEGEKRLFLLPILRFKT